MNNVKNFFNKYLIIANLLFLLCLFCFDFILSDLFYILCDIIIIIFLCLSLKTSMPLFNKIKYKIIYFIIFIVYNVFFMFLFAYIHLFFFADLSKL